MAWQAAESPPVPEPPLLTAPPTESLTTPPAASNPATAPGRHWGRVGLALLAAGSIVVVGAQLSERGKAARDADIGTRPANVEPPRPAPSLTSERRSSPAFGAQGSIAPTLEAPSASASGSALPSATPSVRSVVRRPPAPPFDAEAANSALTRAAAAASSCRKPGDPTGPAVVLVTYAPSGRVTSATVSAGPYAGTVTGGCIAQRFRRASVPAFSGDHVTVKKSVAIR